MNEWEQLTSLDALVPVLVLVFLFQSIPIKLGFFPDFFDARTRFILLKEL